MNYRIQSICDAGLVLALSAPHLTCVPVIARLQLLQISKFHYNRD